MIADSQLSKVWRASASERGLSREDLGEFEIGEAAEAIVNARTPYSLRVEGQFMYGISQIWDRKAKYLLDDSRKTDANITSAFQEYLLQINGPDSSALSSTDRRAAPSTSLELGRINIAESLLGAPSSGLRAPLTPADMSIDLVMRDDQDEARPEDISSENRERDADAEMGIENIDFGIDDELLGGDEFPAEEQENDQPGALDFGPDLEYSSSPPHTPRAMSDADVRINENSSPDANAERADSTKRRKRRGAPVDDVISMARASKPSAQIIRQIRSPPEAAFEVTLAIPPLDEGSEKLVDPAFVRDEMKKRRREGSQSENTSIGGNASDNVDLDEEVEMDIDEAFDNDFSLGNALADVEEESDTDDTPETLESEARAAHDNIRHALRRKGDMADFDELATGAKARACTLMEVLSLASRGTIIASQDEPWGAISLTKVK